jgi:hypothetical protein
VRDFFGLCRAGTFNASEGDQAPNNILHGGGSLTG